MADPVSWTIAALSAASELAAVESEKATLEGQARVKDVAAGAVLLTAVVAVIVGLLVLGPPLYAKVMAWAR